MSYIDAVHIGTNVLVSERSGAIRRIKRFKAPYFFYADALDPDDGQPHYTSMFGDPLDKYEFDDRDQMMEERENVRAQNLRTYESDVRTEYKLLEQEYLGKNPPELRVGIIDIEVNTKMSKGWASFELPYAEITAISFARLWLKDTVTLALKPSHMTLEEATIALDGVPDTLLFEDEAELLTAFLEILEDADVTTGWNSEKFDMPYIVARIRMILGGEPMGDIPDKFIPPTELSDYHLKKMCLFLRPRRGKVEQFGTESTVFSFPGRPHLDYLKLYQKFILEPRDSYKLDNILWVELKERKVQFEGSLEDLYNNNFRLYVEYNRQDVNGIVGLEDKLGLIDIANEMAHQSCVFLSDAIGSVNKIEQAIMHLIHSMNLIACDKPEVTEDRGQVAGAFVLDPRQGMYDWCCNFDVKSEYPNTIMMLNISPETLVGQFDTPETDAIIKSSKRGWRDFTGVVEYHSILEANDMASDLVLRFDDKTVGAVKKSPDKWHEFFSAGGFALTANGTVFRTDKEGYIPTLLRKWFSERKEYQANAKKFKKELENFVSSIPIVEEIDDFDVTIDDDDQVEE